MIQTEYVVLTPVGKFVAQWDENPEKQVTYAGSASAVAFFREFLSIAQVSGEGGIQIDPDNLEPSDLVGFCQSAEYGVLVIPDADSACSAVESDQSEELEPALDSVSPLERVKLVKALSDATVTLVAAETPIARVLAAKVVGDALAKLAAAAVIANGLRSEASEVRTISAQRFIDDEIVARKLEDQDFEVSVSPAFEVDGWGLVRVVTDGHHSLAAAKLAGVDPVWHEQDARENDTIALLSRGEQGIDDFLTAHRIDSDYYDVATGLDL